MIKSTLTRFVAPIASAACALALLVGCTSPASQPTQDATPPAETGTSAVASSRLVVGFDSAYPPYGYVADDGSYTGFDIELAKEVARRNNWDIQLEAIDWDAKDTLLNSGAINVIWNGFTMEGREGQYEFSKPYMKNAQVIVTRANSGIASLADLAGKNVLTQTDSAAYEVLTGDKADLAATFASLETIGDYNTAFMQLESGAVDAIACDLSIAAYQLAAKPGAYVQLDEVLSTESYAVGLKLGDTESAEVISKTLAEMNADGFVKTLCDKYADQGVSYNNWILS